MQLIVRLSISLVMANRANDRQWLVFSGRVGLILLPL